MDRKYLGSLHSYETRLLRLECGEVNCSECSFSSFRLSRFRWSDLERLALLQYPVRCRHCHRRTYAGLPLALALYQARRAKRMHRHQDAASS